MRCRLDDGPSNDTDNHVLANEHFRHNSRCAPSSIRRRIASERSQLLAMGLPKQKEPRAQKPRPRRPPTSAMGAEFYPEGHGRYPAS
jgi:hypothetical protein